MNGLKTLVICSLVFVILPFLLPVPAQAGGTFYCINVTVIGCQTVDSCTGGYQPATGSCGFGASCIPTSPTACVPPPTPVPPGGTFYCTYVSGGGCITVNYCTGGDVPAPGSCTNSNCNPTTATACITPPSPPASCAFITTTGCPPAQPIACTGSYVGYCCSNASLCSAPTTISTTAFAGCPPGHVNTALGCIPIQGTAFIDAILRWGVGIGGGIAFLLMVYAGFLTVTSGGDPKRVAAGRELLTAAVSGLILIVLSVILLNFLGINILNLGNLGFSP